MKNNERGIINADAEAIRPKVTMPLLKACPEDYQNRKRRHVSSKQREEKNGCAKRTAGEEIVLGALAPGGPAKGKDADVEHNNQVGKYKEGGYQRPSSSGRRADAGASRCKGQANLTSNIMTPEHRTQKTA